MGGALGTSEVEVPIAQFVTRLRVTESDPLLYQSGRAPPPHARRLLPDLEAVEYRTWTVSTFVADVKGISGLKSQQRPWIVTGSDSRSET